MCKFIALVLAVFVAGIVACRPSSVESRQKVRLGGEEFTLKNIGDAQAADLSRAEIHGLNDRRILNDIAVCVGRIPKHLAVEKIWFEWAENPVAAKIYANGYY